jgi:hypothetical protein
MQQLAPRIDVLWGRELRKMAEETKAKKGGVER